MLEVLKLAARSFSGSIPEKIRPVVCMRLTFAEDTLKKCEVKRNDESRSARVKVRNEAIKTKLFSFL